MCINSWCPDKDPSIKKKKANYLKLPFVDVPYASEHIQQRGKKTRVVCFPGCHFRSAPTQRKSPSTERCCLSRCAQLHLESKTLLSWDSFSRVPADLQPLAPAPLVMPQAGRCPCPRLWRSVRAGCCCWSITLSKQARQCVVPHRALTLLCTGGVEMSSLL